MQQAVYEFTDSKSDIEKQNEIKAHAKAVIRHEFRALLTEENKESIINNCIEHYYLPVDIWHNLGPYDATHPVVKKLILSRVENFIKTGVYKQP